MAWITRDGRQDPSSSSSSSSLFLLLSLCLPFRSGSSGFTTIYYRSAILLSSFSLFLSLVPFPKLSDSLLSFRAGYERRDAVISPARRWIRSRAVLTTSRVGTVTTGSEEDLPTSSYRDRGSRTRGGRVRRSRVRVRGSAR